MDEWNRAKMSEPPPVYNLMIFPGRRDAANQENKETQTLSPEQDWNVLLVVRSKSSLFAFFFSSVRIVLSDLYIQKIVTSISLYSKRAEFVR